MQLSEHNRNTFLVYLHKMIDEAANDAARDIVNGGKKDFTYPINSGLNPKEQMALDKVKGNDKHLLNAIRKVVADSVAAGVFSLLNVIDATGDPYTDTTEWTEVLLIDKPEEFDEHRELLHDYFYEMFEIWKKKRKANYSLELED